ncbi:peptidase M19 [Catellatospora methionotrophica]|uniref:Peptidase M19 n=1 Tax=Catellatospora methionotrophica TaxID=121620 RepID=A0A8J3L4A7_9ACTN|nr:membrane dipeptidase [Catellatospora methionotrophica]GIG11857.1 peptidase M19 [Catellatospora methionotrophica]
MSTDYMIINALGILDNPNAEHSLAAAHKLVQDSDDLTIDARTLADAHASGLTAVNITLGYTMGDAEPYSHTLREIDVWDRFVADNPADLVKVLTADDIRAAHRDSRVGIIYGFQNAVAVGDDPTRIAQFHHLGVRVIQLTYNQANHIGDGSMAPGNRGLSAFGHEVVEALCDSRIMVDLSHSGENTCLEATRAAKLPVSINHTGCRALVDLPRNKTDEELRLVAERGGFVGIYFMPFVNATGHARAADVVNHIAHAVNVCGEDFVGIGTDGTVTSIDDLDGYRAQLAEHVAHRQAAGVGAAGERADTFPFVEDLRGVDQFHQLIRLLEQRGFNSTRIEKIMGRNFLDYADRVWAA